MQQSITVDLTPLNLNQLVLLQQILIQPSNARALADLRDYEFKATGNNRIK